jgi:TIR domain
VFLDRWELVAGDLIAVGLQQGLAAVDAVVFVVSAESVGRGWIDEELAAAIAAAVARRQRLIPVLAGEVALPPVVASRLHIDFRNVDSPAAYEAKLSELAAAIRGDVVTFSAAGKKTRHKPAGLDARARAVLNELAMSRVISTMSPLRTASVIFLPVAFSSR